jgi:hypothetical protein
VNPVARFFLYNTGMTQDPAPNHIGTLNERSLHAALKEHLTQPGDQLEARVDGYVIDIVRGETLIEVQTGGFFPLRRKLTALCQIHPVHLYAPIAQRKYILRLDPEGNRLSRRKSPRKGSAFDLFNELLSLRACLPHPNLWLHVLLCEIEEVWVNDGNGSWRKRYWSLTDQRLLNVQSEIVLHSGDDFLGLLPPGLPQPFTNTDLSKHANCRARLAGKATYALSAMGLLGRVKGKGRAHLFEFTPGAEHEAINCDIVEEARKKETDHGD